MILRVFLAVLYVASMAGCSSSNNLLLGRVEAVVAGHTVVVTDCYRTSVPQPVAEATGATFTPCAGSFSSSGAQSMKMVPFTR